MIEKNFLFIKLKDMLSRNNKKTKKSLKKTPKILKDKKVKQKLV